MNNFFDDKDQSEFIQWNRKQPNSLHIAMILGKETMFPI